MRAFSAACLLLVSLSVTAVAPICARPVLAQSPTAQQGAPPAGVPQPSQAPRTGPSLARRPPPSPGQPQGLIRLDVVVTDGSGKAVAGLKQQDFTLLDNKKPQPILSFHAVDGVSVKADPPVEIILLLDAANAYFSRVAYERFQLETFLRRNGGHLAQPVSVMLLSDAGVTAQPQPSTDGNAVAAMLHRTEPALRGPQASLATDRTGLSLKALLSVAAAEEAKPGRKLLIWIGSGWPLLESTRFQFSEAAERYFFNSIVSLSTALREARITLYNVNPVDPSSGSSLRVDYYKEYLKGVRSAKQADPGDLALQVLAEQSGGRVLNTSGAMVPQIDACIGEATAFYTLSFAPARADHVDEYHELQVEIDQPHLKARTNAAYYAEPSPIP